MTRPVPVTFDYSQQEGSLVELAGSFNNWTRVAMERGTHEWSITMELLPGTYQYKFIVDNEWTHHQGKPSTKDSRGILNNVIVVEKKQDQHSKEVRDLKAALVAALQSENSEDGETALLRSVSKDKAGVCQVLLEAGADINKCNDRFGVTPLMKATINGNVEIAAKLLSAGAEINMQENLPSGKTALFYAASKGYIKIVKMIVERGQLEPLERETRYIDICTHEEWTPLMAAAEGGHTEIIKLLVDNGAQLDKQNNNGDTALIIAAQSGQAYICELLLKAGADINKRNNGYYGETALDIAKEKNDYKALEIFEKYRDSIMPLQLTEVLKRHNSIPSSQQYIDTPDYNVGKTALGYAAANGKTEASKLLIEAGADVNKMYEGMTALNWAAKNGHTDICEMLVEAGADVEMECEDKQHKQQHTVYINRNYGVHKKNQECYTPLMNAIKFSGNADVVNVLIKAGADFRKQTRDGQTALCLATHHNHPDIVKVLLMQGVEVDLASEGSPGWTPLLIAAEKGNTEICKLLVDNGANLDKQNDNGDTALIKAAENGSANLCEMLLKAGADINKRNYGYYGKTAMDIAKEKNNSEVVKALEKYRDSIIPLQLSEVLRKHGISEDNLDKEDNNGNIVLQYAAANGKYEACKLLIESGADVNKMDIYQLKRDQTALNLAAIHGYADICQMLIDAGAEVDPICQDEKCNRGTPLMNVSKEGGNINVINLLLKMGANVNACNREGKTPLYIATYYKHPDVVKALIQGGADVDMADTRGNTPLIISIYNYTTEICQLLLEGGANVNLWNKHGMTALNEAVTNGNLELCRILLDGGASLEYHKEALPPLANAIINRPNAEIVKMLIKAGSDVNLKTNEKTPLFDAINRRDCQTDIIEILIEAGADLNVICKKYFTTNYDEIRSEGWTPLTLAVSYSHGEVCQLLVKAGAEVDKENEEGWTALGLSAKCQGYEYRRYGHGLIKAGANTEKAWEKCDKEDQYLFLAASEVEALVLAPEPETDIQKYFPTGKTALFYAAARGDGTSVHLIMDRLKEAHTNGEGTTLMASTASAYTKICTNEGWTPLMAAAEGGHKYICISLMDNGAELNKQNNDGDTALIKGVESGNATLCKLLIEKGAGLDTQNNNGDTALIKAAESKQEDVCEVILTAGAELNKQNDKGDTALIKAVESGQADICKMLVVAGANLDKQNNNSGDTALIKAAKNERSDICEILLAAGADINKRNYDYYGDTAWDIAINKRNYDYWGDKSWDIEILEKYKDSIKPLQLDEVLKKHGISENNLDEKIKDGHTELHYTAANGKIEACKLLIEAGASVNIMHEGETALNSAAKNGYSDICEMLIDAGADVDTEHQDGFTPLMNAIKFLGKSYERTSLWWRLRDVVNVLIKAGANVNRQTREGQSPLFLAVCQKDTIKYDNLDDKNLWGGIAGILVSGGAEVDLTPAGSHGWTPLMAAAQCVHDDDYENSEICRFLLSKGARVDKQNDNGDTALIIAAEKLHPLVCEALLDAKADVNKQNHNGDTALIKATVSAAATAEYDPTLNPYKMILVAGADIEKRNNDGKTAMDITEDKDIVTEVLKYRDFVIPLHLASANGKYDACKTLIKKEILVHEYINKLYKYETALYVAAVNGHADICELLLDNGAHANLRAFRKACDNWWERNNSRSPLMGVIKKDGNIDIINLFIKMEENLDEITKLDMTTPLCLATRHNRPNVVKALIKEGVDVNKAPYSWKIEGYTMPRITPLIESVQADTPEICQLLLEAGADGDKEANEEGWTALVYAAKLNRLNIGKILTDAGVDTEKAKQICHTEEELNYLRQLNLI